MRLLKGFGITIEIFDRVVLSCKGERFFGKYTFEDVKGLLHTFDAYSRRVEGNASLFVLGG